MSWKIKEETKNATVYQQKRDDAYVVITIPKTLLKFIKGIRHEIPVNGKIN